MGCSFSNAIGSLKPSLNPSATEITSELTAAPTVENMYNGTNWMESTLNPVEPVAVLPMSPPSAIEPSSSLAEPRKPCKIEVKGYTGRLHIDDCGRKVFSRENNESISDSYGRTASGLAECGLSRGSENNESIFYSYGRTAYELAEYGTNRGSENDEICFESYERGASRLAEYGISRGMERSGSSWSIVDEIWDNYVKFRHSKTGIKHVDDCNRYLEQFHWKGGKFGFGYNRQGRWYILSHGYPPRPISGPLGIEPKKDRHYLLRLNVEGESNRIFVCYHESKREWVYETLIPFLEHHLRKSVNTEDDIPIGNFQLDELQKLIEESNKIILTLCNLYIRDSKWAYITSQCYHIKPFDTIPVGHPLLERSGILENEPFNRLISVNDIIFWNNNGSNEAFWLNLERRLNARSTGVLPF